MLSMQALYQVVFYPKSHARRFLLKDKATLRQQRTRRAGSLWIEKNTIWSIVSTQFTSSLISHHSLFLIFN